jgi:hypothetical protein
MEDKTFEKIIDKMIFEDKNKTIKNKKHGKK